MLNASRTGGISRMQAIASACQPKEPRAASVLSAKRFAINLKIIKKPGLFLEIKHFRETASLRRYPCS